MGRKKDEEIKEIKFKEKIITQNKFLVKKLVLFGHLNCWEGAIW